MSILINYLSAILLLGLLVFNLAVARGNKSVFVNGYTKSNGTYVNSHYRSPPSRISNGSGSSGISNRISNYNFSSGGVSSDNIGHIPTLGPSFYDTDTPTGSVHFETINFDFSNTTSTAKTDNSGKNTCTYKGVMTEEDLVNCGIYRGNRW